MAFSLLTTFISLVVLLCKATNGSSVPAIYVFGDSIADVGNNNYVAGTFTANYLYNGIDYPGAVPTGRCTNGYNGIDFLAQMLGFKESPPAFFSLKTEMEKLNGINFASAGSGIFDSTAGKLAISLGQQVINFKEVTDIVAKKKGKEAAKLLLSESLYLITIGTNDIFAYGSSGMTTPIEQFISSVVLKFEEHLTNLYKLGARKFGMIGVYQLGCTPAVRRAYGGWCAEEPNSIAREYNRAVEARLEALSAKLEGMKYSFVKAYDFMSLVLAAPADFGFEETKAACCGSGLLNAEAICALDANVCSNRKNYLFWDRIHLTQEAYRQVVTNGFNGTLNLATPINIKQLVEH